MFNLSIAQLFILVGLVLVIAELIVGIETGFDLVVIGSIFLLSGLIGFKGNTTLVLILAIILTAGYFVFGRKLIKSKIIFITKKTNVDKLIGARGTVVRSITPDTAGMVRINDEDWRAKATTTLFEKDKVEVESIEGVTLQVKKIK